MFGPHILRPLRRAAYGWNAWVRELRKYLLSAESARSESRQELFANIRGQIGFRACGCIICNRPAYALVYRGCDKGVDVAHIRPALHDCHARDLSAFVDLVRHDCQEVGTMRKQRVEVGHDVVLPDES